MKISLLIMAVAAIAFSSTPLLAHEGHDDASAFTGASGPASAPVTLSAESIANLGVKTAPAALKPLAETISLPATITLIPERQAFITTRFDGLVREIKVKSGEKVSRGQDLITVEPVAFGGQPVSLKSPIDGTIIQQNVVIGQPVSYETILLEVGDDSRMLVKGALYETAALSRIKSGQKATALIGIYKDRVYEGVIERVDAGPQAESRALHAYAVFDNEDRSLRPNLRGTLSVEIGGNDTPTVVVPASAVLDNNGVSFIFVREGSNFEKREVLVGRKAGSNIEIISGVLPDEEVVIQGNYQIQYLKPTAPATDPATPAASPTAPDAEHPEGH